MSKTVVDQLRANLAQFTATERRVAHQLLADWPMAGLQSATDLARTTGVSTPTVLRLAARLREAGSGGSLVTLLCDRGERYEDTVFDRAWLRAHGVDLDPWLAALRATLASGRCDWP